jgi:hypothetical protein
MEDQFAKVASAKKKKVAKNEYQRLRNLAAAHKVKVPREGLPPVESPSSNQVRRKHKSISRGLVKCPKAIKSILYNITFV